MRTIVRFSAVIFLLGLMLPANVCAWDEMRDPWIRGVFTGHSPRPQFVTDTEAWERVNEIVSTSANTLALVGGGESMQPLYPPGTILVLRQVPFSELRSGQTAVYRNRAQHPVAHVLVAKCRDGWRVKGLSNRTHDPEAVVADNLVGVVIAAFTPQPTAPRRVASR